MPNRMLPGDSNVTVYLELLRETEPQDGGIALIQIGGAEPGEFELKRRYFRILWLYALAKLEDLESESRARGLRPHAAITGAYARQNGFIAEITFDALRQCVCAIRRDVRQAAVDNAPGIRVPRVIQNVTGRGYRVDDIRVILIDHARDLPMNTFPNTLSSTFTTPS